MYLIDTNIFLEVMLSRKRKEECKCLLRMLRDGKIRGIVTDFTIHSIIVLLDRLRKLDELKAFLLSLTAYKGLYVYTTSIADEIRAIEIAKKTKLDMDDAIQYSVALSVKVDSIVSFDRDFDGLDIPRREPKDIIKQPQ
ncbi:MAG: PIN domain nuclease [Thermoprotei archaeon]|nr:MAG: PIN domain nuclease [Thermoprotei archaeon]RLF18042.1 MAG: PIN domain nuclease [Thermoprotei archaeon]